MQKEKTAKRYNVTYLFEEHSIIVEGARLISLEANWLIMKDTIGNQLIINGSKLVKMEEVKDT